LYDDNDIQIDGSTNLAFTEDVLKRFEAYGWHTLSVKDGDNNFEGILEAIEKAKSVKDQPSIIKIKTTIGFGSKMQGTEKVHGSPLAADDVIQVKKKLGFDPERTFFVPEEISKLYASYKQRGQQQESEWISMFQKYSQQFPQLAAELQRRISCTLPAHWKDNLPRYSPSDAALATRKLSENVLNSIAESLPELVGGSADLTHSNLTRWKTAVDFQKDGSSNGNFSGRYFRFGVREHGMAAICNGIAAYGALVPFDATFLNFIGYAQGAVRLSALSHFRVIHIMTHDSIGLGEDGPTHQPIEILSLLRATPNLLVFRPADGNEVSAAYLRAIESVHSPSVICLTRQNLPQLEGSSIEKAAKVSFSTCKI
jgi:transketolase